MDERTIHYGPSWDGPGLRRGETFALCNSPGENIMSTHLQFVNCRKCLDILAEQDAIAAAEHREAGGYRG